MNSGISLLGRSAEQAALRRMMASLSGGMSAALVLRGDHGIGKSALLQDAISAAEDLQVARLQGVQSEMQLGYAGLHRLLVPFMGGMEGIPEQQQRVLGAALGMDPAPPASQFLLGLAVLALLGNVAHQQPLLCVIDDAQWLDRESCEVLAFVARRAHADRFGLLFAVAEPPRYPLLEGIPELAVSGLDAGPAAELLVALAPGRLDWHVAGRIAAEAEGNPLALTEIGRELAAGRTSPSLLQSEPLPVGQRLVTHFRRLVGELPRDSQRLLLLASAQYGGDVNLVWRAAESEGLEPDAILAAESAHLVASRPELHFRHSLIRNVVYQSSDIGERRRAHQVLAGLTDETLDADRRAWHLAAAAFAPDEALAAELERCAEAAHRRGGYLAQAAFLTRAAELSPEPGRGADRYLAAAQAAMDGGAPHQAETLLDAVRFQSPQSQAKAIQLRVLALFSSGRPSGAASASLLQAARLSRQSDPELTREILLDAIYDTFLAGHRIAGTSSHKVARDALRMLEGPRDGTQGGSVENLLLEGMATIIAVGYMEAVPILRRAVAALTAPDILAKGVPQWFMLGFYAADALWDAESARGWGLRCERVARQTGALRSLVLIQMSLSFLGARTGRIAESQSRTVDGRLLLQALGSSADQVALFSSPELLSLQGHDDAARLAAAAFFEAAQALGIGDVERQAYEGLATMHMGRAEYQEAFAAASRIRVLDTVRGDNRALPVLVEAGIRVGRNDEAAAALTELELRATASGTPWALGLLARCRALMAPHARAEGFFQESIGHLATTEVGLDLARSHLAYGEWLRRRKRTAEARIQLSSAFNLFTDMGAPALADRARHELMAAGGTVVERVDPVDSGLTAQEERVALLAANGLTNQEVAAQLFLSVHTVEYHLGKVFRKLGITSRRKLSDALAS